MYKPLFLVFILFTIAPFVANGQGCNGLIKDARTLVQKLKFDEAVKKVEAAKGCASQADIDLLYSEIFAALKKQTSDAKKAKDRAEKAESEAKDALQQLKNEQEKTNLALLETEKAKAQTDSAFQKAQKLIDAFYFYDDKFALAYGEKEGKNVFYFIDKNGNEVIKLGRWEKAEQFDWRGFAKVKMKQDETLQDYLIDTLGNFYRVAYEIKDLKEDITAMDLSEKDLSSIPVEVIKQRSLKILLLNSNQLSNLPPEIGELKNLTDLALNSNKLSSLPPEIGELKNLTSLELAGNQLSELPVGIGKLSNLQSLNFNTNNLQKLPPTLWELKELTELVLSKNQLTELPEEISNLSNLQVLYFGNNNLQKLPLTLWGLKELKMLYLGDNPLYQLPPEIGNLSKLRTLYLTGSQLQSLPDQLWELRDLEDLSFFGNPLTRLSPEIKNLTKMKELALNATLLSTEEINNTLHNTHQIEVLYLRNLRLTQVPDAVFELKNLKKLVLQNRDDSDIYKKEDFNNFSEKEQENVRKRLPGVEIEF